MNGADHPTPSYLINCRSWVIAIHRLGEPHEMDRNPPYPGSTIRTLECPAKSKVATLPWASAAMQNEVLAQVTALRVWDPSWSI
jgi:hypothetical protein